MTAKDELPEPEVVLELGQGLEIWKIHVDRLREQDVNARAMTRPMFDRLTQTIGRDQRLESLPLCAVVDDHVEIVSGHHRVRGARAADVQVIHAIVDVSGLTPDQVKAKQLAHNAIAGEDVAASSMNDSRRASTSSIAR